MAERRKSRSTIEDQAEIDPEEENNEDTTSLYYQVFTLWKRRRCIEKEQLFSEKSNDSDEMYKIIAKQLMKYSKTAKKNFRKLTPNKDNESYKEHIKFVVKCAQNPTRLWMKLYIDICALKKLKTWSN